MNEPHYIQTREDLRKLIELQEQTRQRFPEEYARIYAAEQSAPDADEDATDLG